MPWTHFPLTSSSKLQLYSLATEIIQGCRQRCVITNTNLGTYATCFPFSSAVWQSGTITSVTVNGDGTITLTANDDLGVSINWTTKFTAFALLTYAPAAFKICFFPPDNPNATVMANPALGLIYEKTSHSGTSFVITDDGRLTLNGQNYSGYVGYKFQVLRSGGGGTQRGFGWVERFPSKPNEGEHDYGTITSSTTISITDNRDASSDGYNCPKPWPAKLQTPAGAWREIIFKVGALWKRVAITGVDLSATDPTLTFAAQLSVPTGGYWIVDPGSWWRPEFRLQLVKCTGRSGDFWARPYTPAPWHAGGSEPWDSAGGPVWDVLSAWNSVYTDEFATGHSPPDDTLVSVPSFVETIQMELGESGPPVLTDITVWDVDASTSMTDLYNPDHKFNPWLPWSMRGLQIFVEDTRGGASWVEPKTYTGLTAIPLWTWATWQKHHSAASTRTSTISAVSGGGVATISITLPTATPGQAYASLPCYWQTFSTAGDVKSSGTGLVTATTLTRDSDVFSTTPPTDVGCTVVIAFGWRRKYERRVRYLYPRSFFVPDTDLGAPVLPPTSDFPGYYQTTNPSTTYAEYNDKGDLLEGVQAVIAGESARYVTDNLLDPFPDIGGSLGPYFDLAYQGIPNVVSESTFPRWEGSERTGTITAVGSFWIEDSNKTWWVSDTPLIEWTGTTTSGTTTMLADTTRALDGRWLVLNRFVGMIAEISHDGGVTYEPRPVTAYNQGTQALTVTTPFSATTNGKLYRIREPGYSASRGAILNLWEGRYLIISRPDGSTSRAPIAYSDKTRLFYSGGISPPPQVGDTYAIEQHEPGIVLQRKTHANAVNGFVLPEDATQDTRGQNWHVGDTGPLENCPTMVNAFGRIRRGDVTTDAEWWNELYRGVDCLRMTRHDINWSSRAIAATPENNEKTNGTSNAGNAAVQGDCATVKTQGATDFAAAVATEVNGSPPTSIASVSADAAFGFWTASALRRYAYAVSTPPTGLPRTVETYVRANVDGVHVDGEILDNGTTYEKWQISNDDGIAYDVFVAMGAVGPNTVEIRKLVGNTSIPLPTWPDCPPAIAGAYAGYISTTGDRRYTVIATYHVANWAVVGGLTYVS